MADLLATAALLHFARLKALCGVACTVTRGETEITPTIVLASTDTEAITTREATLSAGVQDILVSAADFADLTEPQEGDVFVYSQGGDTITAEARPASGQEKCFTRWRGDGVFQIHCKITGRSTE